MKKAKYFTLVLSTALLFFLTLACIMVSYSRADENEQVFSITAKRFEYSPDTITVKNDIPVVLKFTSLDRLHGFFCPGLGIRTDIPPNKVTLLRFVPQKVGTFPFHCDINCGSGHEGMTGQIVVTE